MTNIIRNIVGGAGTSNINNSQNISSNPPNIFRAVVVESYLNPELLTSEEKNLLKRQVQNPIFVDIMPANSLTVRVITSNLDIQSMSKLIVFPLFSSHFQLPIIAGEQVFVIFEDYDRNVTQIGYWIDRVHEINKVEDVNYTHSDRKFNSNIINNNNDRLSNRNNRNTSERQSLEFPNGGNTISTYSLFQEQNANNPYDIIVNESLSYRLFTPEPVPRWIRRPNELLIQNNNNAAIVWGTDRIGSFEIKTDEQRNYAGTIDIVCGRGRDMIPYSVEREPNNTSTAPLVARNRRNKLETDKNPAEINKTRNPNEGNPSFKNDAARIYISMNTFGDKNFDLENRNNFYPQNTLTPENNQVKDGGIGNSYIISKADNIRTIARKDNEKNINGTLMFIKEGTKDEDLSFMFFDKSGKIQVEGKEIFFGKSTTKSEPYIKYSIYEQHINDLKQQIKKIADQMYNITNLYNQAFRTSNAIPYNPIASLVIVGNTVKESTNLVKEDVNSSLEEIRPVDVKSIKIFGE
jgi:hypothetical protein